MSDEQVESSTTAEAVTEEVSEDTSSAETKNTDTSEHMIPKSRLDREVRMRREAEEARAEMEAQLSELRAKARETQRSTSSDDEIPDPPAGMTQKQQIAWYTEHGARRLIERETGMKFNDFVTMVKSVPDTSRNATMLRYQNACSEHGVDPKSREAAKFVSQLLKGGAEMEEAMKAAAKIYPLPRKKTPPDLALDGVTNHMTKEDLWIDSPAEAAERAHKGQVMPLHSATKILERSVKKRARK